MRQHIATLPGAARCSPNKKQQRAPLIILCLPITTLIGSPWQAEPIEAEAHAQWDFKATRCVP